MCTKTENESLRVAKISGGRTLDGANSWAEKYRPKRFEDEVGVELIVEPLRTMIINNKYYPLLIFSGPSGVGKTSTALNFIRTIFCLDNNSANRPCGKCISCADLLMHKNLLYIKAGMCGGVDSIRRFHQVRLSGKGIAILFIDEAHSLSHDAQAALLNVTEMPDGCRVTILVTTEIDKIIPPLQSRGMIFEFHPHRRENVVKRLQHVAKAEGMFLKENEFCCNISMLNLIAEKENGDLRASIRQLQFLFINYGHSPTYQDAIKLYDKECDDMIINLLIHLLTKDTYDNHAVNRLLNIITTSFSNSATILESVCHVVYNALFFLNGRSDLIDEKYLSDYARLSKVVDEIKLILLYHHLNREFESVGDAHASLPLSMLQVKRLLNKNTRGAK